ncbi:DUF3450 domain-containing protein [Halomonas sp. M20]|uniref:DUF3450 domain-containing protein n=1 Tax=Halomonas sp. M20 TaxID=2763264 RepID=UPI001D09C3AB|nr:DUF3450 domain-containing protein [Halomonas sp. M20]
MIRSRGFYSAVIWLLLSSGAQAEATSRDASRQAPLSQAEQQAKIDAADDETHKLLTELRRLEGNTRRLTAYNDELEQVVTHQAGILEQRSEALESAKVIDESLPPLLRTLVQRLDGWIARDMPFLRQERSARVANLEQMLVDPDLDDAERLDRVLSAWRTELNYGREMGAWRGMLDEQREVDFLRLGRAGLYYLTPDGREGGVWDSSQDKWQPLSDDARQEVRNGLRIARDQRAPELLNLPVSHPVKSASDQGADT